MFPFEESPSFVTKMGSLCYSCVAPSHSLSLYFSYLGWAVVTPVPGHLSLEEAHLQYWWLVLCGGTKDDWTITSAHRLLVKVKSRLEVRLGKPNYFQTILTLCCSLPWAYSCFFYYFHSWLIFYWHLFCLFVPDASSSASALFSSPSLRCFCF